MPPRVWTTYFALVPFSGWILSTIRRMVPLQLENPNDLILLEGDLKKMRRTFADSRHDCAFSVFGAVDHDRLADAKAFTHCRFEVTERARGRDDCRADDVFLFGSLQHSRDRSL